VQILGVSKEMLTCTVCIKALLFNNSNGFLFVHSIHHMILHIYYTDQSIKSSSSINTVSISKLLFPLLAVSDSDY